MAVRAVLVYVFAIILRGECLSAPVFPRIVPTGVNDSRLRQAC